MFFFILVNRLGLGGSYILGSREGQGTGSCEYGNELYGSINYDEFLS